MKEGRYLPFLRGCKAIIEYVIPILCFTAVLAIEYMGYRQRAKEYRELQHFAEFMSDLKDNFYFCKSVTESIFRAAERLPGNLRKRLEELCFLLEEEDMRTVVTEEQLTGNEKFFRLFQLQCRSAVQYGSGKSGTESVFVRNVTELRRDVQNECYQRTQAMHLFAGMGVVTVLPVVFLPFIRWFGSITMEELEAFYEGRIGRVIVAVFVLLTVGCYSLLCMIRRTDKRMYRRSIWLSRIFLSDTYCRWSSLFYGFSFEQRGAKRLSEAGIEGDGMQYWSVCAVSGLIAAFTLMPAVHAASLFGKASALFGGFVCGFSVAMGFYKYVSYLRRLGMKGEVLGLQSMVLLLAEVPNITIMGVLDVLGACGELFQKKLLRCADEYTTEDVEALEHMLDGAEHPSFRELTARMIASERIGIKAAFEELAADRSFYREQIRLDREQEQKKRAANAQIMVFLPMLFLLFAYLILPFLGVSLKQMGDIFREMEQIRYL